MTIPRPETYADIDTLDNVIDRGETAVQFFSSGYWYGRCGDGGCKNLHVLLTRDRARFEVAMSFTVEDLENMLHTAKLIRARGLS